MTHEEIREARRLALAQHNGRKLSVVEGGKVMDAYDAIGPEGLYMDGELFFMQEGDL